MGLFSWLSNMFSKNEELYIASEVPRYFKRNYMNGESFSKVVNFQDLRREGFLEGSF